MLAKLLSEHLAAIGAKDVSEVSSKLTEFIAEHNRIKTMADNAPVPVTEARVNELISAAVKPLLTEARATELITSTIATAIPAAMSAWAGSEGGKKLIGAEASRITAEAMAATGTVPVKPAPTPAGGVDDVEALEAAGKYEEAYAKSRNIQAEFPSAANYAAFRKNQHRVRIVTRAD
jgi:hypothetical protein